MTGGCELSCAAAEGLFWVKIRTTPSAVGPLFINFLKNLCTDITAAFAGAD
jgi:hypothetical protein